MSDLIRNTTWDDLRVGAWAALDRVCTPQDLLLFAHVSGNLNPLVVPSDGEPKDPTVVAPSMWVGSIISSVLGNVLPGPGTLYRMQTLRFSRRVAIGERLMVMVTCVAKGDCPKAVFETLVVDAEGATVCEGLAEVDAPTVPVAMPARELPHFHLDHKDHFARLLAAAKARPAMPTAVVCPDDRNALGGALLARDEGLIEPVLIGDLEAIRRAAAERGTDLAGIRLVAAEDHRDAARRAVAMAAAGEVAAIMKGNLHSDELLAEVVRKDAGLRGTRRLSHVFVMSVPSLDHPLFISDAALNIAPDLVTKVDIVQNAIDLAIACGVERPRVGVLAAVETVNVNMPSTLDAAALSKMAERGQIRGGLVDGPLAMDNAVDLEAARTKGIASLVAGRADVLVVPNLEAGNMLAKELTFVARADAAGLVVGARVPIILTSRADNDRARVASCALAQLHDAWRRSGTSLFAAAPLLAAAE
ncbi:bifunctional enoyl-CoA hydratase/phosphate acetyltransferase [Prosthecomicrobium sp. N25]|uniref:bifunctional enoyl-CoA hydratase/phosphate acetyltransferase n=1 Tax=Prosthecomicrobium sp. N25 TaxID=3129254 RepID=UPI003078080E